MYTQYLTSHFSPRFEFFLYVYRLISDICRSVSAVYRQGNACDIGSGAGRQEKNRISDNLRFADMAKRDALRKAFLSKWRNRVKKFRVDDARCNSVAADSGISLLPRHGLCESDNTAFGYRIWASAYLLRKRYLRYSLLSFSAV